MKKIVAITFLIFGFILKKMDYVCFRFDFELYIIHFFQNEAENQKKVILTFFLNLAKFQLSLARFFFKFYSKMCF